MPIRQRCTDIMWVCLKIGYPCFFNYELQLFICMNYSYFVNILIIKFNFNPKTWLFDFGSQQKIDHFLSYLIVNRYKKYMGHFGVFSIVFDTSRTRQVLGTSAKRGSKELMFLWSFSTNFRQAKIIIVHHFF